MRPPSQPLPFTLSMEVSAYGDNNQIIETYNVPVVTTMDSLNAGTFVGITRDSADIRSISFKGYAIVVDIDAMVTAAGDGEGSDGGRVYSMAQRDATLRSGAVMDASAGASGDGGPYSLGAVAADVVAGSAVTRILATPPRKSRYLLRTPPPSAATRPRPSRPSARMPPGRSADLKCSCSACPFRCLA